MTTEISRFVWETNGNGFTVVLAFPRANAQGVGQDIKMIQGMVPSRIARG
jgi:hypothetical protein